MSYQLNRGVKVLLEVKNLMVFFENALALNDFSMTINQGEIVGVIGSNSAGKTTLMNTVSGLIIDMKIKEQRKGGERINIYGEIVFNGENITDVQPFERVKKGLILSRERHPIFAESDVAENLKIAGHQVKRSDLAPRMEEVYAIFPALNPLKKRKAGFLSGGEQQMLAIGMALIPKPKLLLLDEPLLGLSPMMQTMLIDAITTLRQESGITILITEQFARPVLPIIDRGYVIENGMLALSGTGAELMDNPEIKSAYFGV
jgi:branched-chain amino acid transport system ATP-binding protein